MKNAENASPKDNVTPDRVATIEDYRAVLKQAKDYIRFIGADENNVAVRHIDQVLAMPEPPTSASQKLLAETHTGMKVDYRGLLKQAQRDLRKDPGIAEMLRQLEGHLTELGQRWYAGDTAVVDEMLQLYCIERDARKALVDATEGFDRD